MWRGLSIQNVGHCVSVVSWATFQLITLRRSFHSVWQTQLTDCCSYHYPQWSVMCLLILHMHTYNKNRIRWLDYISLLIEPFSWNIPKLKIEHFHNHSLLLTIKVCQGIPLSNVSLTTLPYKAEHSLYHIRLYYINDQGMIMITPPLMH